MRHKIGDTVFLKAKVFDVDTGGGFYPYNVQFESGRLWVSENDFVEEAKDYNKGLEDAWELAKKILYGIDKQVIEIFDVKAEPRFFDLTHKREIINRYTPQEAFAKTKAYEESKEIRVRDEVINQNGLIGVVFAEDSLKDIWFIRWDECNGGAACSKNTDRIKKTGKHIDIQKILDELKEGAGNEIG